MTVEKNVEYKGETFTVVSTVWSSYVDFSVNGEKQNLDTIRTWEVQTMDDFKKYAKQAIQQFIKTRKAKEILDKWDGKL